MFAWIVIVYFSQSFHPAQAEPPRVYFDLGYLVAAHDVTSAEFAARNRSERLVEVRFQISALIRMGNEDDLVEFFYRIESPVEGVQIVDYLPQTTLTTDLAGNIGIEKRKEDTQSIGLAVAGSFDPTVKANPSASVGTKDCSTVRYELLPPQDLLASSGTIRRGQGVYFKLKPSRRSSLEGAKEFVVVLRVPAAWRGGLMQVDCRAVGYERGVIRQLDEHRPSGTASFMVALYVDGDEEAKAIAEQYVRRESELRRIAADRNEEILRRSFPTVMHRVGSFIAGAPPRIPDDWLVRLIYGPPAARTAAYDAYLPDDVRGTVERFGAAQHRMYRLSGLDSTVANLPSNVQ